MKHVIFALVGFGLFFFLASISKFLNDRNHEPEPVRADSFELKNTECVETCIRAMNSNRVFPNFDEIVKECDIRFGDGCEIRSTK